MKRCMMLLLVLVLVLSVVPMRAYAHYFGITEGNTQITQQQKDLLNTRIRRSSYVKDGKIAGNTTGLVKVDGQWYYVKKGVLASDVTGLVKHNGEWFYVKKGVLASDVTSLVKHNGEWFYVVKGKVASNTTTLVKLNGEWFYVVKGKVASNTTTLVKYNNEWWYVVKGKIASKTTTLVKYNNEWWYVVKGKIASNTTTLVKYNGSWYYIYKGKLAANTTTLVKYNGSWYYVENGRVNFSKTGLFSYGGAKYYIKNGIAQTGYTGYITWQGQQIYLKNGAVSTAPTAKPVVDAVSYERKVIPPEEIADLISPGLKQIVHIPKLNYSKPGALALNRKIYADWESTYEYVKNTTVDEYVFQLTYEYREHNGIVGIIIEYQDAPLLTGFLDYYPAYYYDANNDRELTQKEYYKALGINASTLTSTLKKTPIFRSEWGQPDDDGEIQDVLSCIADKDSAFVVFESDMYEGYLATETNSIL